MTNAYNHLRNEMGQSAASTYRNNRRNGVPAVVALKIARDQFEYYGENPNPFKILPFRRAYLNQQLIKRFDPTPKKASFRLRRIRTSLNHLQKAA